MKVNKIDEIIRHKINQLITEELGIAQYVETATKKLYDEVVYILLKIKGKTYANGVKVLQTNFNFDFNGVVLNVAVNGVNFRDNNVRQQHLNEFPDEYFAEAGSVYGKVFSNERIVKNVWLNVLMVSGQINRGLLLSAISHELRHIYDQKMNNNNSFSKRGDNNLYIKCADLFNNGNTEIEREIGFLGYMSFNYERRACVEEFFTKISYYIESDSFDGNLFEIQNMLSNDNDILNGIVKMRTILDKIINNDEEYLTVLQNMLNDTGMNISRFISRCKESIEDLSKRYGKCVIKLKNDYPILQRLNNPIENIVKGNKPNDKYQI